MQIEKKRKVHLIFGILLSVLLVISALCFIIGAYSIYRSSDRDPYTYESIGRTFSYIAIPVFLTVIAVIGGVVLHFALPLPTSVVKARREAKATLDLLAKRVDRSWLRNEEALAIDKERRLRRVLLLINIGAFALGGVACLIYSLIPANFTGDYNRSIIGLVLVVFASLLIPLALCIVRAFVDEASIAREISATKTAIADMMSQKNAVKGIGISEAVGDASSSVTHVKRFGSAIRISLLLIAVLFVVVGIFGGGMADVLAKAIKICTECIGLG